MSIDEKFEESYNFLESLSNIQKIKWDKNGIDPKLLLNRSKLLMKYLKNPEKDLKIIHVTGTAGKGSVSKILEYSIYKNGYKCGIYTSPHASHILERFEINNSYMTKEEFINLTEKIKPAISKVYEKHNMVPSFFDISVAMAFLYFKEQNCDYVVMEVGLGGRFDSTNVVRPIASVITNVGLDHTEVLGDTKEKIAFEKAGIIKKGVPIFTAEKDPVIQKILEKTAEKNTSRFYLVEEKKYILTSQFPSLKFSYQNYNFSSKLLGKYQIENIILASEILKALDLKVVENLDFSMPARLEILSKKPLIICDGAHNLPKFKNLKSIINEIPGEKHIVFALAENKSIEDLREVFKDINAKFYLTRFNAFFRKAMSLNKLKDIFKKMEKTVSIYLDPQDALSAALKNQKKKDTVIITGSFYLAGELRKKFIT